jgi:hypothetical protein
MARYNLESDIAARGNLERLALVARLEALAEQDVLRLLPALGYEWLYGRSDPNVPLGVADQATPTYNVIRAGGRQPHGIRQFETLAELAAWLREREGVPA